MKRSPHPAVWLLLGLVTAHLIGTLQVNHSNTLLHTALVSLNDAGYLTIPNQQSLHHLQEWKTALLGGLFFTLTVGAGLSVFGLGAVWTWDRLFGRRIFFLIIIILTWLALIMAVNWHGPSPRIARRRCSG